MGRWFKSLNVEPCSVYATFPGQESSQTISASGSARTVSGSVNNELSSVRKLASKTQSSSNVTKITYPMLETTL